LLKSGTLGQVKWVQASFGIDGNFPASHRVVNHALGGGGILDLGCYPASMARLVAGVVSGADFSDPVSVQALGHVGERSGVDEYTSALLQFPSQIIASLAT